MVIYWLLLVYVLSYFFCYSLIMLGFREGWLEDSNMNRKYLANIASSIPILNTFMVLITVHSLVKIWIVNEWTHYTYRRSVRRRRTIIDKTIRLGENALESLNEGDLKDQVKEKLEVLRNLVD